MRLDDRIVHRHRTRRRRVPSAMFATGIRPDRIRGTLAPRLTASVGPCLAGHHREHPIHPSVAGAFHARRAAFHVILGVEMRARGVGRSAGVNERERAVIPLRHQRGQRGMEPEKAVEVDHGAIAAARAIAIVGRES